VHLEVLDGVLVGGDDADGLPRQLAHLADDRQAEAQLAARLRGDPWLGAGEVMTLSFVEARLLSVRLGAEAAQRVGATAEQREILGEAIRAELFAVMERVHAEGGRSSGGWIHQEWPAIAAAIVERCARPIPTTLRAKLAQELPALLAR
jgi:hypothetical protein